MPEGPDDARRSAEIGQLTHQLRQPLSAIRLLLERAQHQEDLRDVRATLGLMAAQVDEAVAIAQALTRTSE